MSFQHENDLPILSQNEMINADQRIEAANKAVRAKRRQNHRRRLPALDKPLGEFGLIGRRIIAGGAVLAAAGVTAAVETQTAIPAYVNAKIHELGQGMNGMAQPKPEDATNVKIGDVITYKTKDGRVEHRTVRLMSDITAAAREVNPQINYSDFDSMLEAQNRGSAEVHYGDSFKVDESLGLKDVGPSGD
jgi:hypothetical protein